MNDIDPIRYLRGPGTGYSATEFLVRIRKESLLQDCGATFEHLPPAFTRTILGPPAESICPVFLEAAHLLPRESADPFVGRLREGLSAYLGCETKPQTHGCPCNPCWSDVDRLHLVTNFRLRFASAADASAAYEKLRREPSVQSVEWCPLRVIAVPVLRGQTRFKDSADRSQDDSKGGDSAVHELVKLVAGMKECACHTAKPAPPPDPAFAEWGRQAIERPPGRNQGEGIAVAILDLGVDHTHQDLAGRVIHGLTNGTQQTNQVQDGTFLPMSDALNPNRPKGHHGTAVAGIIAGATYGLLPKATVVSFQVASGRPFEGVNAAGRAVRYFPVDPVLYASALWTLGSYVPPNPIPRLTVLNMSIGGQAPLCHVEETGLAKVAAAGIVMIASAGNNFKQGDFAGVMFPARHPLVLSVGAVGVEPSTGFYKHATFSNFDGGDFRVNLVAPGVGIYKCVPAAFADSSGYSWGDGTSYASPHVAAIAAECIKTMGSFEPKKHSVRLHYQKADCDFDDRHGWGLAKWPGAASTGKAFKP